MEPTSDTGTGVIDFVRGRVARNRLFSRNARLERPSIGLGSLGALLCCQCSFTRGTPHVNENSKDKYEETATVQNQARITLSPLRERTGNRQFS